MLDQDAAKLTLAIESYLGVQHLEGLQVVRLPYYRQLSMLNPQKPMRRSEQFIARQVFSGLTRLDEEEQLQPDLAYACQALSDTHWRFYLRPGVRFHNGNLVTTELIVQNLWQLRLINLLPILTELTHLTLGRSMHVESPIPAYRYWLPKPVPKSSQRSPIAIPILI